jgi:hypothetical protein
MAMFSRCSQCGCKAMVVVLTGALIHSAVHHQDLCLRQQPSGPSLYCTKYVAEPVHTHEDARSFPTTMIRTAPLMNSSSPSYSSSGVTTFTIGRPGST